MHIVYLSRSLLPSKTANSVHVMKMCQAISNNGHTVNLVASMLEKHPISYYHDYYGVKNCFEINALKGRSDKFTGLLLYLFNFFLYIKKIKPPDLFYGRDLFTLAITALTFNVPFYFEAHKPPTSFVHKLLTGLLIKNKNLVKLIVITNPLKEEYLRLYPGLINKEILVSPDGADIPINYCPNNAAIATGEKIVIGYVGHLYSGRGMNIIHALARELPQYEFHIIGGNEKDVAYWQNICLSLDNIHFKGFVPHGELYRYYREIDIVLAPYQKRVSISGGGSDTSQWMSPLKIFEYMSFTKPIIASDLPVLKEVLIDRFNAILCKPECIDEWSKSIKLLVNDKKMREHISKNAFDYFKNNYTWEKRVDRILTD
ncbi:MAG: glycosyltransferase family 4 protein [Bacillota bacterium]